MPRMLLLTCLAVWTAQAAIVSPAEPSPSAAPRRVPVIDVTDLYHPHQDVGDNFDVIAAYALPEIDLRAVILDCTEPFRQPVAKDPGPGLFPDPDGPREPGFIPVWQLNYIFQRNVPCAAGPFTRMKSVSDKMLDVPPFQQQGVELLLKTLQAAAEPVHIVSFGSARAVAAAYNREPALFRDKAARIHLCAGGSSPPAPGYVEWNVALDPAAIVCLLRSGLPIALYPCAANNANSQGYNTFSPAFSYDTHNSFYKLPDLQFIRNLDRALAAIPRIRPGEIGAGGLSAGHGNRRWPAVGRTATGQRTLRLGDGSLDLRQRAAVGETGRRQPSHCPRRRGRLRRPGAAQRTAALRSDGPRRRHFRVSRNGRAVQLFDLHPRRPARERGRVARGPAGAVSVVPRVMNHAYRLVILQKQEQFHHEKSACDSSDHP